MKTENTLRTVRNSLLCFFTALGAGLLAACGSSGGGVAGSVDTGSGSFHASDWVVGLDYTYLDNGETGKTGERGAFSFPKGQTVAFSIGEVPLGDFISDTDEDFVTPTRIASGDRAINIERLLIALDSDADVTVTVAGVAVEIEGAMNGTISLNARSATDAMTVWSALTATSDPITVSVEVSEGVTVEYPVPSSMRASMLLANTNNCGFSGAFEGGYEGEEDGTPYTGDQALVLLAFDRGSDLPTVSSNLGSAADGNLGEIIGVKSTGAALFINLWKEGGSSETAVTEFGSDGGVLDIDLNTFPVVREFVGTPQSAGNNMMDQETVRLTLESYDRIAYESTTRRYAAGGGATVVYATESGDYRRAKEEVRDADYRIAGFYSDENNGETPAEAEIGIYAFSANAGGGSVRPYVGWFSSPHGETVVYSNIGEGRISSPISYTGTPGAGPSNGMMVVTDVVDSDPITVSFTHSTREVEQVDGDGNTETVNVSNGYGTFQNVSATGTDLLGGWCAL